MESDEPRRDFKQLPSRRSSNRDDDTAGKRNSQNDSEAADNQQVIESNQAALQKKNVTYKELLAEAVRPDVAANPNESSVDSFDIPALRKSLSFHPSRTLLKVFSKTDPDATIIRERVLRVRDLHDASSYEFDDDQHLDPQTLKARGADQKCRCATKKKKDF